MSHYECMIICVQVKLNHLKRMQVWLVLPTLTTHSIMIGLKDESEKVFSVEVQFPDFDWQWIFLQFVLDWIISQSRWFIPCLLHNFGILFRDMTSLFRSRILIFWIDLILDFLSLLSFKLSFLSFEFEWKLIQCFSNILMILFHHLCWDSF